MALRNQEYKNRENTRSVSVETTTSKALISCDGIGDYDWSDQAEEGPTNFALMAYSSTSSNSKVSTDSNCSSSCLENFKILKEQNEQLLKYLRTSKINAITYKTGNFMPLKHDLSLSGLEEFVNEPIVSEPTFKKPVVETSKAKSSADKPKVGRKNNGAPIFKDWVSDNEEEDVPQAKKEKKTAKSSFAKIKFVKSKEQVKIPRKTTVKQAHSTVRRPINNKTATKNSNFNKRVNIVSGKNVNTTRPKAVVNAVRPKAVLNAVKGNQDQGVIDNGCSRHMTGNMSYLTDFEEIDKGYVTFRGNPKIGKITGRGTIKTGNLDFENVYFVRELQFNLFSVSQMCDKKNSVLFNDTECIVLSPNFKLTDESHVLLKVPRKNNMYSVDLKNIVPKGGLTCLFAKATSNESKLWHRRLGHINFKTMNKLVKGNLVRGLPSKLFENDQTCVACQKGKQHRASCKSKTVFFLATKNETSGIPKSFITGVENLIDQRVRVIRCDNETEFKNKEMNQFCERKENGPNWLFDIDALTKSMNYKPVIARNQSNGNAGKKACDDAGKAKMETSSPDAGFKPLGDNEKKVTEEPRKEGGDPINDVGAKTSIKLPDDLNMPELEDIVYSDDAEDVGAEADMNNLNSFMPVSPIPTTRIHKDHPVEQIIRDLNSAPQTRRMTKNLKEHGLFSYVQKRTNHKDFQKNVFACFLSQEEPKKMDIKSAFLYGKIEEEVYVCQQPGFKDPDFPDRVYKVEKALYGLHQALRAWYETLSTYLLDNGFQRRKIDKTMFIKKGKGNILLVQVYVDDIIFGSIKKSLCTEFEKMMHKNFQMSSMGELTFFLGLQVKQKEDGIFISQDNYVIEISKKFGFTDVKTASTSMETQKPLLKDEDGEKVDVHLYISMIGSLMYLTSSRPDIIYLKCQPKLGLWYPKDSPFDLVAYTDSDYAGASLDRKSTTGGCQFLGCRLISWQYKNQTVVANSITEAECVAASS
ncbi:putative ribonuclease H-like domain-containing protein [Tanacetum coccineum]|uniref:Ribonuclease H-like domain-containing protein n=1 Tax=Tanacetum coccineum TaxID=301880 RepID=A0ABQ5AHW1_9ASTR